MIPVRMIGLLVSAAGFGLNLVSGWVEEQQTKKFIEEEVDRQLNKSNSVDDEYEVLDEEE